MGRCPTLQLYSWPNTGVTSGALTALPRLLLGCHANDMLSQRRGFLERPPDDRQIVESAHLGHCRCAATTLT